MTSGCKPVVEDQAQRKVLRTELGHGAVLIVEPCESNAVVAISVLIKSGSRNDPPGLRGLHSIMARTLRKGTQHFTEEAFDEALDRLGASMGAGADRDSSSASLQCTQRHLAEALPFFFEMLRYPLFPDAAITAEKLQTVRGLKEREDQFMSKAFDLFQDQYYGNYPYHFPMGKVAEVEKFSRADVVALYKQVYQPQNIIISVVGPVDAKDIEKQFRSFIEALATEHPESKALASALPEFQAPTVSAENIVKRETVANWVIMGFSAPPEKDADEIPMQVMNGIMGGSMNSRLFVEVRDKKGLAYQVGSSYGKRNGPSFWAAYFGTKGKQLAQAKQGVLTEIDRIKNTLPDADELKNTQSYMKGSFLIGQEHNMDRAGMYAEFEAEGRGLEYVTEYPRLVDKVNAEDVQRVAKKYLSTMVVGAVLPK